ncbi:MAG TPA: Fis family transcriptional regulator [Cyanobacteria bacterium UBA8803]|nr:Fis family transcriptional regulator [Cyanobacteria bacterium UBA9273]HBL61332.1 Fis family transcriptional regulator [Cyanobacteria bacterium UBA8803]
MSFAIGVILNLDFTSSSGWLSSGQAFPTRFSKLAADFTNPDRGSYLRLDAQVLAQTPDAQQAEANELFQQGIQQYQVSQFQAAIQSWQEALTIYREIGNRQREGSTLGNLGVAYYSLGDYAKAIDYHQQRLAITREIGDRHGEGQSLGNLGLAYNFLGDYAKAIDYHQQRLTIAREIGDRHGEGQSLGNLGISYHALGNYAQAIEYHQQSLAILREIGDRNGQGTVLGNLGTAYRNLGDYGQAIEYHQQRLAIARETGDLNSEGESLGNLGNAYHDLGDYTKAIDYHQQSLVIFREIGNRNGEGTVLGNLGNVYHLLGDYAKAIDYHRQRLAIAKEIGDRNGEGESLNNLGADLLNSGNLSEAERILSAAMETWEGIRRGLGNNNDWKVSIFEQQAATYLLLQQVFIAQNKITKALEISERGRARAFVELLARGLSSQSTPALTIPPPSIDELKEVAQQQKATIVEYSVIKFSDTKISELYVWIIKPTGEVAFEQVNLKSLPTPLPELVRSSRESIGVRGGRANLEIIYEPGADQKERLQQLYGLLIKPIANLLPTNPDAHIIFIPHQELFLVPFPALQDESGKYLIEKHTILTAPSIQVLELTRQQRAKTQGQDMLIVGNPTMPSISLKIGEPPSQLASLPGAQDEAIEIGRLFNTKPLIGNQATETLIKSQLPKAGKIHLATHGLLDYGQLQGEVQLDLPGAIALAPSSQDDGLLTASEIFDLQLKAELVVLSACDTGRGDITSDGVIGLSRSFINAGTPSVIVSLWNVPDAPTADLMKEFYRQLQQHPDKAKALREAMLVVMKPNPNPKDWAAFTLIGEAQ